MRLNEKIAGERDKIICIQEHIGTDTCMYMAINNKRIVKSSLKMNIYSSCMVSSQLK